MRDRITCSCARSSSRAARASCARHTGARAIRPRTSRTTRSTSSRTSSRRAYLSARTSRISCCCPWRSPAAGGSARSRRCRCTRRRTSRRSAPSSMCRFASMAIPCSSARDRPSGMKLAALVLLAACGSSPAPSTPTAPEVPAATAFPPPAFTEQVTGSGRPVIFIPGLASPVAVWDGTLAHLGGHVQAHVLTLAGVAGVKPIDQPFLQQVQEQIVQYIDANHLDHRIIVGHSLGGVMSLWLAETDPAIGGVVDVEGLPFLAAAKDP